MTKGEIDYCGTTDLEFEGRGFDAQEGHVRGELLYYSGWYVLFLNEKLPIGESGPRIPFGRLIEESDAEKLKLKYGCAFTDNSDIDNDLKYSIDTERQIESRKFIEIVEGRLEEIIENVWYQIPSEYYDKLLGGIILTGGGSNMKNIEKAFTSHTHVERIRIAKFPQHTINSTNEDIKSRNGMMNTRTIGKGDSISHCHRHVT